MPYTPITVAYPAADDLQLRIALGACRFEVRPGVTEYWVDGTCYFPTYMRAPRIRMEGRSVTLTEEEPYFNLLQGDIGDLPSYKLEFGRQRPFALAIETADSEFDLDLGGVPLKVLTVRQRAGRFNLDFSAPNPEPMGLLEVESEVAGIELENLANAGFLKMRLSGGAAGYDLDFGGILFRDAQVAIETGLSGVEIAVPRSTSAKIVAETTVGSVDVGDGFIKSEDAFVTEAATYGKEPLLTIRAEVRLGALQVRVT